MSEPSPERILQIATGDWASSILAAAVTHSLFNHLEGGASSAEQVAKAADISVRGAQVLLDGLLGLGLIELRDGAYGNTAEASAFLVEGRPAYLGGFAKVQFADSARRAGLPEAARTGLPVTEETNETPEFAFWEDLVPAIAPLSVPSALAAAEQLRIADAGPISILDVGGGSGIYSAVWLAMNPQARSTQIDWANVNRIATRLVSERGVGDRFRTVDGDFHTTDFGTAEHDIGVYSHIAHQESPAENVAVFRKFRTALKPGGTLVVNDFVVDNDRSGPPFPLIFHATMLLHTTHGATWTKDAYRAWLNEAGFTDVTFQPTPSPATLVLAK